MSSPNSSSLPILEEESSMRMSRNSTPASDFGRLALGGGGTGGGDMPPTTRSMTKGLSSSHSTSRSHAMAGPSRGSKGAARGTASSRGQTRDMPTPRESDDSDEDDSDGDDDHGDDDDDDDDDEESSGDEDSGNMAAREEAARRLGVYSALSAFEPGQLSYAEMVESSRTNLEAYPYGKFAAAISRLVRNNEDFVLLMSSIGSVQGAYWSRQTATNMNRRARRIFEEFGQWVRNPAQRSGNVIDTVSAIFSLYYAVDTTLRQFQRMQCQNEMVSLLLWTLDQVIANDHDVRDLHRGAHPVYAGGATQHEHNLFLRFTSSSQLEQRFWQVLQAKVSSHAEAFQQPAEQVRLRSMWERLSEKTSYENAGVKNFIARFRLILINLRVLRA